MPERAQTVSRTDRDIMTMLDDAVVSYHLVLTKVDQLKAISLGALYEATASEPAKHPAPHPAIFTKSCETGSGIADLRTAIFAAALA